MIFQDKFPFFRQLDSNDCAASCLRIVCKFYGKNVHPGYIDQILTRKGDGSRFGDIEEAGSQLGFSMLLGSIEYKTLKNLVEPPCIIHWKKNHFVVVYKVTKRKVYISDPSFGKIAYSPTEFTQGWMGLDNKGICLLLEPKATFHEDLEYLNHSKEKLSLSFFFKYLYPFKKYYFQLFLGLLLGSVLQMIFPILTQSIVDYGIANQNLAFVNVILLAQTMLFFSRISVEVIRTWIFFSISSRVNIYIISDFLDKLMRLRISYFENKMIGDILQRIGDHGRIQAFISTSTFGALFSLISIIVYSVILAWYNLTILYVFFFGSLLYFGWISIFLKKRKELDYKSFSTSSKNQSLLIQILQGIRDIKLNNAEKQKRWDWEDLQAESYQISISQIRLSQVQSVGSQIIDQIKNLSISYLSAKAVIEGQMTLGMMLAVQYMIGQLSSPISQVLSLSNAYQDAKISLERLAEVHSENDELILSKQYQIPKRANIEFKDVSFTYNGSKEPALHNINFKIEEGKTTSIVGMSGSGKTTLIKLLLQFYDLFSGEILIGDTSLSDIDPRVWRRYCSAVLQESYIFSDTVYNNVAVDKTKIDHEKFVNALKIANIKELVDSLPLGFETKIGNEGHGLSQGQKQRILIARAIYKEPKVLFLDEATNSLDALNENMILDNINKFSGGKTLIIVAHKLNTIKNSDHIIVLDKGTVKESGSHEYLMKKEGYYFNLVRNQQVK